MSNEVSEKPKGFGKWFGRSIALILIAFALFILFWYIDQPAGNTAPSSEQVPAQTKPANPGDKKFNL